MPRITPFPNTVSNFGSGGEDREFSLPLGLVEAEKAVFSQQKLKGRGFIHLIKYPAAENGSHGDKNGRKKDISETSFCSGTEHRHCSEVKG